MVGIADISLPGGQPEMLPRNTGRQGVQWVVEDFSISFSFASVAVSRWEGGDVFAKDDLLGRDPMR